MCDIWSWATPDVRLCPLTLLLLTARCPRHANSCVRQQKPLFTQRVQQRRLLVIGCSLPLVGWRLARQRRLPCASVPSIRHPLPPGCGGAPDLTKPQTPHPVTDASLLSLSWLERIQAWTHSPTLPPNPQSSFASMCFTGHSRMFAWQPPPFSAWRPPGITTHPCASTPLMPPGGNNCRPLLGTHPSSDSPDSLTAHLTLTQRRTASACPMPVSGNPP